MKLLAFGNELKKYLPSTRLGGVKIEMFRDMSGVRSDSTKPPVDVPRRTPRILEDEARRAEEEKVPVAEGDKELQHRQTRVDT